MHNGSAPKWSFSLGTVKRAVLRVPPLLSRTQDPSPLRTMLAIHGRRLGPVLLGAARCSFFPLSATRLLFSEQAPFPACWADPDLHEEGRRETPAVTLVSAESPLPGSEGMGRMIRVTGADFYTRLTCTPGSAQQSIGRAPPAARRPRENWTTALSTGPSPATLASISPQKGVQPKTAEGSSSSSTGHP